MFILLLRIDHFIQSLDGQDIYFSTFEIKMSTSSTHKYSELYPSKALGNYVASYFEARNESDKLEEITICPDAYFKLIIQVLDGKVASYFLTGLWAKEIDIVIQPRIITYGIRFKVIAPEYILRREIKSILNSIEQLNTTYFDIDKVEFTTFPKVVEQLERIISKRLPKKEEIRSNRLRLSQFLYSQYDDIKASEVASQIYWSQREINRYLNKYIGLSLKKYLNIQKCYRAYFQIRDGEFFPEKGFFDQAHFIREVKKHTGKTPSQLYKGQNDQFIQLKNMKHR